MRLLIVEDDPHQRRLLSELLRSSGHAVDTASDGASGLEKALGADYDAILLDHSMPHMTGRELLRRLRQRKTTPVIFVSGDHSLEDRVTGLDLGADDFLAKPFAAQELMARLRAVMRRRAGHASSTLTLGDLSVDLRQRTVDRGGEAVHLTPSEYSLFEYLLHRGGEVVSRDELYEHLFGDADDSLSNLLDVHICNLRRKLGNGRIRTRRGMGYAVDAGAA